MISRHSDCGLGSRVQELRLSVTLDGVTGPEFRAMDYDPDADRVSSIAAG